jgi:hypothetical protein
VVYLQMRSVNVTEVLDKVERNQNTSKLKAINFIDSFNLSFPVPRHELHLN